MGDWVRLVFDDPSTFPDHEAMAEMLRGGPAEGILAARVVGPLRQIPGEDGAPLWSLYGDISWIREWSDDYPPRPDDDGDWILWRYL